MRQTVTIREAAHLLGISATSAYELARRGALPGVLRLGRRLVVSRWALARALSADHLPLTGEPAPGEKAER